MVPASQPVVTQLTIDASGASTGAAQYVSATQKAEDASNSLLDALDKTQKVIEQHGQSMNQLAAANDNVGKSWGDVVSGAENVGLVGFEKTTENILNTINHLKLLALGIYAISPAFRGMVNSAIPVALGAIGDAAGTAAKSVLAFAAPMLSFFASITAPIAAVVIAWKALTFVWQQGVDLLQKYRDANQALYASDVASNLTKLTQYQGDTVSAAQAQYAGDLADRLATAKNTISQFFEVQLNVTDLALRLQGVWVGIVEAIAGAVRGINAMIAAIPSWFVNFVSAVGTVYQIGTSASFPGMTPPANSNTPAVDPTQAALTAARGRLGALMGTKNIGTDGAPLGTAFATRFSQDVNGLANVDNSKDNSSKTNSYQRADQGIQDQIQQLQLEADGASKTSQAVEELKVAHTLNQAAMKAGIPVTDEMREKWKDYGDQIAALNIQIKQQQQLQQQQFQTATMFMSPADLAAANVAHSIDPTNWQAHMSDLAAQTAAFNSEIGQARDLTVSFFGSFNNDIVNGTVSMTTLTNAMKGFANTLLQMAEKNLVNAAFGGALGGGGLLSLFGLGGGASSSLAASNAAATGASASDLAFAFHTGGIVGAGEGSGSRYVHPAYFENAPRFHSGGIAGNEVPIIAQRGEGVFTPGQMAAMGGGGGGASVTITNNNDFRGADPSTEGRMKAYVDQQNKATIAAIPQIIARTYANKPGFLVGK